MLVPAPAPAEAPAGAAKESAEAVASGQALAVLRMERGIRSCANSRRRAAGVRQLAVGAALGNAARLHAQKMAKGGFFSHTDPQGRGPAKRIALFAGPGTFSATGENIAAGLPSPGATCSSWMSRSAHRANILNPAFTHVGGGFAFGGFYGRYYVLTLGRVN
ncbi:MAG: CAP domain-containing protein [Actinomycetota bacterium]|nr:CAP domain-containing protein [Actinomycetota bacterium]